MPVSTFVVGDVHGRRAQLRQLLSLLPRDAGRDALVLLGDLIDRGEDIPGTVADVLELIGDPSSGRVVVLRGNHEQMLLDFLDDGAYLWLHPAVGGGKTFGQYTGEALTAELRSWWEEARRRLRDSAPAALVPPPPRIRPLPDLRRRPHRAVPHDQLHPRTLPRLSKGGTEIE